MGILLILIIASVFAVIGAAIGEPKGLAGAGAALGFFLSIIGIIIIALLPANETKLVESGEKRKCPFCAEFIKKEATVCRFCGKDLPAEKTVFGNLL